MPELPDLTVFAENLSLKLNGKQIKAVDCYYTQRLNVTPEKLRESIVDSSVKEINRAGKELEFVFSNGTTLSVHLMLAGGFKIVKEVQPVKFKIMSIAFSDGNSLVISDPKGLVTLTLNPEPKSVPDALDIDINYIKEKIREKPKALAKAFLIDQKKILGIGNAYADEILWHAKISPKSVVGKLPDNVIEDLVTTTITVLRNAIEQIKKANPEIISGEVRDFLSVHNPSRRQSPTGRKIIIEKISSKKTYYTYEQILYS